MKFKSAASWGNPADNGRSCDLEVDDDDARAYLADQGRDPSEWDGMTVNARFKLLSQIADRFVVAYLAREGVVTTDWARDRLKEIEKR